MAKNSSKIFSENIDKHLPNNLERKNNMKIIDLLNKIANGEELPKKIIYDSKGWKLTNDKDNYITIEYEYDTPDFLFDDYIQLIPSLNDEVKVIEEEKPIGKLFEEVVRIKTELGLNFQEDSKEDNKKIEKVHHCWTEPHNEETEFLMKNINVLSDKINEIIEVINNGTMD